VTSEESSNQSLLSKNTKIALVLACVTGAIFFYASSPILALFLTGHFDQLSNAKELLPYYIVTPCVLISAFSIFYGIREFTNEL
jgi:Na+-driven multidrug efflux pump